MRFKPLGVGGAFEPRYTTSAILLLIPIFGYIITNSSKNLVPITSAVVFLCGYWAFNTGDLIGKSYYQTRFDQAFNITQCHNESILLGQSAAVLDTECFNLAFEQSDGVTESEVVKSFSLLVENGVIFNENS